MQKCHKEGHSQILFYNDEEKLMGYAILFIDPSLKNSAYLHKVYVNEENRHNGIGTKFLNSLNNSDYTISLLSPPDKIPFFFRKR